MNDFHIRDFFDKFDPHTNLIFWISMIKESLKVAPKNSERTILDFGCGDGKFLHLYKMIDAFKHGYGIELDDSLLEEANKIKTSDMNYAKYSQDFLDSKKDFFDIVYSQEVLYTIKDLKSHAKEIFDILKPDSYYFATMGSHIQNPLWSLRRTEIRKDYDSEKSHYYAYDYSLDEVASIFYEAGFEVGLKRLPLDYFMVYHPKLTREFSNSFYDLTKTAEEEKMLFLFWKPYDKKDS